MNTASVIVWVLMSYVGHGYTPTLEFKNQEKCQAAATTIKNDYDSRIAGGLVPPLRTMYCIRIEK